MFDLGSWGEFIIIALAILILIGPKELPSLLRTVGRWAQKLRRLSLHFREHLDSFIQEGEFDAFQEDRNASILASEKSQKPKKSKKVKKSKAAPKSRKRKDG